MHIFLVYGVYDQYDSLILATKDKDKAEDCAIVLEEADKYQSVRIDCVLMETVIEY